MTNPNREKELFEAALDIPSPEERTAFLEQACAGDKPLHQRIQALLQANESAGAFLPDAPRHPPTETDDEPMLEASGTEIDRYTLLEQIGEGGFGVVYMAQQTEPVRRRVALKIIKPGMDTKEVIGRFEAERQALAMMDHPHIAQVYDAGATEAGRPYFVMELVRGIPITQFCRQQDLDIEARLTLFIEVCAAVQHAHQKGIIHRDLKPTNILVTLHGEKPVPKVIDFGIAKATEQPLTDKTVFTQFHHFMGTPAYMSPEQAALSGLDVDTRSDIYSLGVLLYEILTGSPPFDTRELLSAGLDEMRRIIRVKEPERPSTRIRNTVQADSQPQFVANLVSLATDLDWIVMKALEKDRDRRYSTANGLAADLKRHLNNEPVTAVAPTLAYQLTKFYQRNHRLVRLAGTFGLLLVALTFFSTWQAYRATEAKRKQTALREEADRQRDEAKRQREAAELARQLAADRANDLARQIYYTDIEHAVVALKDGQFEIARAELEKCGSSERHWEWHYLYGTLPKRITIPAREQPIFTRDGKLIMAGGRGQKHLVKVWDPVTGTEVQTLIESDSGVTCLALSVDEHYLVTGHWNGMLRLWDAKGGELWSLKAHDGRILGVAYHPNGSRVASCGEDDTLRLWDTKTGAIARQWTPYGQNLRGVAFSPDGGEVATGIEARAGGTSILNVWNIVTGDATLQLQDEEKKFKDIVFSADGRWIATAAVDGVVKVWSASTGEALPLLPEALLAPTLQRDCISFSADSSMLVVADAVGMKVVDVTSGQLKWDLRLPDVDACYWTALSPNNRRLATFVRTAAGDHETYVWDLQSERFATIAAHDTYVWSVAFSPDGQRLASASEDHTVKLWDVATGSHLQTIEADNAGRWANKPLAFTPNGNHLILAGDKTLLKQWELETGVPVRTYFGATKQHASCAVSPDGRWLAGGGRDRFVRLWDISTGELMNQHLVQERGWSVYDVAFSPDGRYLAVAGPDALRIRDLRAPGVVHTLLKGTRAEAVRTRFSPDGRLVLASSAHNNVILAWDVASGQQVLRLSGIHKQSVWGLAISPDGERIASADEAGIFAIWDAETGHPLFSTASGQRSIWNLAWSPDGKTIASAGGDGSVKLWRGDLPATDPRR